MPEQGKPWEPAASNPDESVYDVAARLQAWADAQKAPPAPKQLDKREPSVADFIAQPPPLPPPARKRHQAQPIELFPDMMTMDQAASYVGMKKRFLQYEVKRGNLHVKHFGRAVRLEKSELDRYKKAH